MILGPNGAPLPPSPEEQAAEQARIIALMTEVQKALAPPRHTTDHLLVAINLFTFFVFEGPYETAQARFRVAMGNLEAAMNAAQSAAQLNHDVNRKLAADASNDRVH